MPNSFNEIYKIGNLVGFEKELELLYDIAEKNNLRIVAHTVNDQSWLEGSLIRISLKNRNNEPVEILWDILHELGHFFVGARKKRIYTKIEKLKWEIKAWEKANQLIQNDFKTLLGYKAVFDRYKKECLKTYL